MRGLSLSEVSEAWPSFFVSSILVPETLTHIGRYDVQSELGRGAMGVVFKAFDPLVERTVAIKTIPLNVEGPDLLVHRLQLEAKSVGQLEHPNIVTLYDAGEANGVFYLAMQFIQGETLRDRIARQRWFSLKDIQDFLRQICSALDYAHQHGVIHRDIKPSNIMVTPDGVVKLTDFGIAKLAGGTTTAGLIMGTPSYMSPEQALGKPLDGRSDIFSLGSILYEMITGEQAFPGSQASTVMYRIVHEPPSPIAALQPGLDPRLESIVFQALAKQPEQRYQTCAELAAALDHYVPGGAPVDQPTASNGVSASRPDLAPTASLPGIAVPAPRRSILFWSAGGLSLVLLIVAGVWGFRQLRRPGAQVPHSAADTTATITTAQNTMLSSELREGVSVPAQPTTPPAIAASQSEPPEPRPTISTAKSEIPASPSPAGKPAAKAPARANTLPDSVVSPRPKEVAGGHEAGIKEGISAAPPSPGAATPSEQAQPRTFKGYMLKGDLAFQQSHYEEALAAYSKAHQIEPSNREVRRKLATVLTLLGRPEEAQRYK